jgi:hypothetical protein
VLCLVWIRVGDWWGGALSSFRLGLSGDSNVDEGCGDVIWVASPPSSGSNSHSSQIVSSVVFDVAQLLQIHVCGSAPEELELGLAVLLDPSRSCGGGG